MQFSQEFGWGLLGCGRFGRFCLEAIRSAPAGQLPVRPVAVADQDPALAQSLASELGLEACTPEQLLAHPEVAIVHVATPPWTHAALTRQALEAGRHVLCEKPLGLGLAEVDELVELASHSGRILAVNHLLRYNELLVTVKRILGECLLGQPIRAFLENYAEDEQLPPEHWFWNSDQSGGIFIEHGVHFFDLQRWWFGEGQILAAVTEERQPGQVDRYFSLTRHAGGVLSTCYHGFDQPRRLDRADHRILCERGDLRISGWIPERLEVNGICSDEQLSALQALTVWDQMEVVERFYGEDRRCRGRGNDYLVDLRFRASKELTQPKPELYASMFLSLLCDQFGNPNPRLSALDAREAVSLAEAATRIARA
jgi:predicted dehydrogenase